MSMTWAENAQPDDLRWEDHETVAAVVWSDGHTSRYEVSYLRRICPCAVCTNAHASPPITGDGGKKPFAILTDAQARLAKTGVEVTGAEPVGNYAVAFSWSDGHTDGIYSWRYLRGMCPCAECAAKTAGEEAG